ncbi:ragulator complex LAMTOR1-like [Paramuricea clavata]|uniref:Ragulator complex protein LAMTOR1 n=1 Tax=Paramuricea clavata TaxID=317549 RepID=A0A7D9LP81_PARCT|nr:ragulator complex LAMTOR1-like [Paramuricea clavata]
MNDGTGTSPTSYPQAIGDGARETSGSFNKSDQQSMLSRILNQTANNVIDVTTVEPHSLEKGEFIERAKQYQHYGNTGSSSSRIPQGALPPGTAAPQVVLAAEPVSAHDINLVKNFSEQTSSALKNFEVSGGEPFVVQFGAT